MHSDAGFWCGSLKERLWLCRGTYNASAPFTLAAAKSDGGCNTLPCHCSLLPQSISPDFLVERKFPLYLFIYYFDVVSSVAIRKQQTRSHLLAHWTMLEPVEILSVCICLCPSSPTTRQSFVMHVRWSIYSLHLHCALGKWHWSNFSLCVHLLIRWGTNL